MLFLAIKHLFSRKRQTLFTLLGILFGTMAYVVISGFFLGFQGFLIDQLVNNDAHLHITSREDVVAEHSLDEAFYGKSFGHVFWVSPPSGRRDYARIDNPRDWYKRLDTDTRVEAYSPVLTSQVVMRLSKSSVSATLVGCDPAKHERVTNIKDSMKQGLFTDIAHGGNRMIVGGGLLEKLGARVSQTIMVSTGQGEPVPFKIVGSFRTGIKVIDDNRSFSYLSDVQKVNGTPNVVNDIVVKVKDFMNAASLATTWSQLMGDKVQSWDQINANIFSVFKIQNAMRYMMIAVILVIAGFGIYNVLNMTVTQKQKEIAILRSMGYDTSDIIALFFTQGLILGVVGGVIGLIFGYWTCLYLQTVPFGGGPMGGAGFLQISIQAPIYFQGLALALVSSSLAAFLPARAAGKLTPIEIIRSGVE